MLIIVPVRNESNIINEVLNIFKQSQDIKYEVLIINDFATMILNKCKKLVSESENFRIFDNKKRTWGALNLGIMKLKEITFQ